MERDVKGDNVLVRRSDGRAILIDFGSGTWAGAPSLTPDILPPGTPVYRSPEAELFELRFHRERSARYRAQPADDLYALGAMACRLVTGEYPQPGEPWKDESGTWQLDTVMLPKALLDDSRVEPRLRACTLRLLSVRPEERGTARELAEALERDVEPVRSEPSEERMAQRNLATSPKPPTRAGRLGLAVAAAGLVLALSLWGSAPGRHREEPSGRVEAPGVEQPDAGTVGLGDSATAASTEDASKLSAPEGMAEEPLPQPQPGQLRTNSQGRCPRKGQVAFNGGCWGVSSLESEDCEELGGQMFQGSCYLPLPAPKRRPTSNPVDPRPRRNHGQETRSSPR